MQREKPGRRRRFDSLFGHTKLRRWLRLAIVKSTGLLHFRIPGSIVAHSRQNDAYCVSVRRSGRLAEQQIAEDDGGRPKAHPLSQRNTCTAALEQHMVIAGAISARPVE